MKCSFSVETFLERPIKSFWGCLLKYLQTLKVLCSVSFSKGTWILTTTDLSLGVHFPAVHSDSSHKQPAGQRTSWFESYASLPTFQSFLTSSFRDQVKIWSHKRSKWYAITFWIIIIGFFFFKTALGLFGVESSFLNSMLTKHKWRG